MASDSPGQYPPLSVSADSVIGPEAQQRQQIVFSTEFPKGLANFGVLISTISLIVIALFVVWSNFHGRDMIAVRECLI